MSGKRIPEKAGLHAPIVCDTGSNSIYCLDLVLQVNKPNTILTWFACKTLRTLNTFRLMLGGLYCVILTQIE